MRNRRWWARDYIRGVVSIFHDISMKKARTRYSGVRVGGGWVGGVGGILLHKSWRNSSGIDRNSYKKAETARWAAWIFRGRRPDSLIPCSGVRTPERQNTIESCVLVEMSVFGYIKTQTLPESGFKTDRMQPRRNNAGSTLCALDRMKLNWRTFRISRVLRECCMNTLCGDGGLRIHQNMLKRATTSMITLPLFANESHITKSVRKTTGSVQN